MKKLLFLLPFLLLVFAFNFSPKPKNILGRWEVYKIQKPDKKAKEKRKKYIIFNADGTVNAGNIGREPDKNGTWELNATSTILAIHMNDGNKDDGDYRIEKLTRRQMVLERDTVFIFMEKVTTR